MRIIIDIGHPGHVHLYKNFYKILKQKGHDIFVFTKDIKIIKDLLKDNNIDFKVLGKKSDLIVFKAINQISYNLKLWLFAIKNNITYGIGSSITLAQVSKFCKMKSIILDDDDDEVQPLFVKYAHPFCDIILSPKSVIQHRKSKSAIFYNGYHELAYLHPSVFNIDKNILEDIGISPNEPFFIMRFNVFKAHHDVGIKGLSLKQKLELIDLLEPYGKILITTEREIEPELKKYQLSISPEKIHSLMYHATMFIGDSQTMTSEAAVLGTPSIRCNDFVGRISYLEEEEHSYRLTFGFKPEEFDKLLLKVKDLLDIQNIKEEFQNRRLKLLNDKIDVTAFLVWFVENLPESAIKMKANPDYQYKLK